MRLISLLLFWSFLVDTKADVAFTWPISGAVLGSGDITLWWKEDGDALLIRKMGSHLLVLFTGSNNVMVMLNEWVVPVGTYNTTIHLSSNIGPNANNSYFFGIQSIPINTSDYSSTSVPVLTNFSPRFSLTNMTGEEFCPSISAENAICNTTDGPDSIIRDESQDQVSLAMSQVQSLSSAQITISGAIHNPNDGVLVTSIPLNPKFSPKFSNSPKETTILSSSTPTISSQPATGTPSQAPTRTTTAHNKIILAVPISILVATILGLILFFIVRYRRQNSPSEKIDSDGSILPFSQSPPTHPNTWIDTTASTLKNQSNRIWFRLKVKRPRGSVAELSGYKGPSTLKSASQRNTSPSGTTSTKASEMAHTPIMVPAPKATAVSSTHHQNTPQSFPGREVGFLAVGPDSTSYDHNPVIKIPFNTTYTNHSYPRSSTIKTITTESSGIPSSSALSSSFDREREALPSPPFDLGTPVQKDGEAQVPALPQSPTALRGTAKVVTISRSNSISQGHSSPVSEVTPQAPCYPARKISLPKGGSGSDRVTFASLPSSTYQPPQTRFSQQSPAVSPLISQSKRFRSPMGRTDESAAVREAERRIRGLLGGV